MQKTESCLHSRDFNCKFNDVWIITDYKSVLSYFSCFGYIKLKYIFIITVTLYERHDDLNHRQLHFLFNHLFRGILKETSKFCVVDHCEGKCGFPSQGAGKAAIISMWWRHHDFINCCKFTRTSSNPSKCYTKYSALKVSILGYSLRIFFQSHKCNGCQKSFSVYAWIHISISDNHLMALIFSQHPTGYTPSKETNVWNRGLLPHVAFL